MHNWLASFFGLVMNKLDANHEMKYVDAGSQCAINSHVSCRAIGVVSGMAIDVNAMCVNVISYYSLAI